MVAPQKNLIPFGILLAIWLSASCVSARRINITMLDNCRDMTELPAAYLQNVSYHYDPEDGLCDQVHGDIVITTLDMDNFELIMTLYKCEEKNLDTLCTSNSVTHIEVLDCHRLMNDDSGPWHMFTQAMEGGQCGEEIGVFGMTFARLRVEHLMKYLDIYDATYNSFRLVMNFMSTSNLKTRGCGELDFTLLEM